jgi:hypothetical protein
VFDIKGTLVSGTLPPEINTLSRLTWLDIRGGESSGGAAVSHISGTIPDISGLVKLERLFFGYSKVSGTLPQILSTLTSLNWLSLGSATMFSGTFPLQLGTITALQTLSVGLTKMSGTVPVFDVGCSLADLGAAPAGLSYPASAGCPRGSSVPPGSGDTAVEVCVFCDYGRYQGSSAFKGNLCTQCAGDTILNARGFTGTTCEQCSAGTVASESHRYCILKNVCTAGKYGTAPTCPMCPTGKFNTFPGARVVTDCTNCPLGRWSDSSSVAVPSSLTVCILCIAGKYSAVSGSTVPCNNCSPGTYQDTTGTNRTTTKERREGSRGGVQYCLIFTKTGSNNTYTRPWCVVRRPLTRTQ